MGERRSAGENLEEDLLHGDNTDWLVVFVDDEGAVDVVLDQQDDGSLQGVVLAQHLLLLGTLVLELGVQVRQEVARLLEQATEELLLQANSLHAQMPYQGQKDIEME